MLTAAGLREAGAGLTCKYRSNQQNPSLHSALKCALSCSELRTYTEPVSTDSHIRKPRAEFLF